MIRRPPRSTRTEHTLSLHDALPICHLGRGHQFLFAQVPCDGLTLESGFVQRLARYSFIQSTIQHKAPSDAGDRSEEHTSELQSLMRISYAVFCLKKKKISRFDKQTSSYQTNIII